MDVIYVTSKNNGPSWIGETARLVYLGPSYLDAIEAVGEFAKYEKDFSNLRFPETFSALPQNTKRVLKKYYMADGWWYTVERVSFKSSSERG